MCSRLADRDARVVRSVLDEERRADGVESRHRRRLDEEVAVVVERAVLALARGAPVVGRVLEERDEVEMPTISMPAAQSSGWNASAREHHVAAVRAPVEHRARAVDARLRCEPGVQRRRGRARSRAAAHVVEMLEPLAVPRRAADVRRRDRVAARKQVLRERREARVEPRPPLRLRAAVDHHDDGERPVAFGPEQEHGNRLAVEAREAVQLAARRAAWCRPLRARRHPLELVRVEVVDVDVERLAWATRTQRRAASRLSRTSDGRRHPGTAAVTSRAARASAGLAARASSSRNRAAAGPAPESRLDGLAATLRLAQRRP